MYGCVEMVGKGVELRPHARRRKRPCSGSWPLIAETVLISRKAVNGAKTETLDAF